MNDFVSEAQLDFHICSELLPYDVEKYLKEFLEDSYNSGQKQVLVITGKGKVVKPIVERLLSKSKLVEYYQTAGYFNGQGGAFEVRLKD